jgi:hypothetical protein
MSSNAITIFPDEKKLGDDNWVSFKDMILSLARGRGYEGYLLGSIPRTMAATFAGHSTLANSVVPSTEEWDLRSGQMAALIYLNVKDPKAHGLSASDTPFDMWIALHSKFNRTSEVLKGQAMEKIRSVKLASGRDLPAHLDELTKLRAEVSRVGGHIRDVEMNSIILQSLPAIEFAPSMLSLQRFSITVELTSELRTYWEIVHKKDVDAATTGGTVAHALANHVPASFHVKCSNGTCGGKHTIEACWARGGGREGQAPPWWKAPAGMEPRQSFVEAHRAARAARASSRATAAAATAPAPNTPASVPVQAQYISAMKTYALSTMLDADDAYGGAFPDVPSAAAADVFTRCGGQGPTLLSEHVGSTVADVDTHLGILYASDQPPRARTPTYLDSGASDVCVANRQRFITYDVVRIDGSTALKSGGSFEVEGKGLAEFTVKISDGTVHKIRLEALHTPGFAMNLISLPTLDTRGFHGKWGNGLMSVVSREGKVVVDGQLARTMGQRRLYEVCVVDGIDGDTQGDVVAAIAGRNRNQPVDLEGWHRRFVHADVRRIEDMAAKGLVDGLTITRKSLRGYCEDCIFGKQDKMPFDDDVVHETRPLERVHLDLWGKARTPSWSGAIYMMLVADGGTSLKFPLFLNNKRQETSTAAFVEWVTEAEVQTGEVCQCVRFDQGGEFDNEMFQGMCKQRGICVEFTPKDSSSANGHVERGNRTVIEGTRTQLIDANMDLRW